VRFILGSGQQNDMAPACDLIRGLPAGQVLADRAYDADSLHDLIYEQGGEPVIPPRRHRKYRHRYDKLPANFMGFIKLASIMLWLK
jgi:transposase